MIVYNVKRRWFTMKNDADTYRKAEGLKPDALATLRIDDRVELAGLLNALCGAGEVEVMQAKTVLAGPSLVPEDVVIRAQVSPEIEVPDFIPKFLVEDWEKRSAARRRG